MDKVDRKESQQIKINKVRIVTRSTLRGEFLRSFILPVFCSGPWTQGCGHWTVGKDTHSKAKELWDQLWAESPLWRPQAWRSHISSEKIIWKQVMLIIAIEFIYPCSVWKSAGHIISPTEVSVACHHWGYHKTLSKAIKENLRGKTRYYAIGKLRSEMPVFPRMSCRFSDVRTRISRVSVEFLLDTHNLISTLSF